MAMQNSRKAETQLSIHLAKDGVRRHASLQSGLQKPTHTPQIAALRVPSALPHFIHLCLILRKATITQSCGDDFCSVGYFYLMVLCFEFSE